MCPVLIPPNASTVANIQNTRGVNNMRMKPSEKEELALGVSLAATHVITL